jgi:hypothetical protein
LSHNFQEQALYIHVYSLIVLVHFLDVGASLTLFFIGINYDVFYLQMIPVAANDVAFSLHAVALTSFTVFQVFIYEVGLLSC